MDRIPETLWEVVWPIVDSALTPELAAAVALTIAGTHFVKLQAPVWWNAVTRSLATWRAFCASASVLVGLACGTVAVLTTDTGWVAIPLVALGSGPIWRMLVAFMPEKVADALRTETDRRYCHRVQ